MKVKTSELEGVAFEIISQIAHGSSYESEYDGRIYDYCSYCNCGLERHELSEHDEDCLMIKARKILGDGWERDRAKKEEEDKIISQAQIYDRFVSTLKQAKKVLQEKSYVKCKHCGKIVAYTGLKTHQAKSTKCLKAQGVSDTVDIPDELVKEG